MLENPVMRYNKSTFWEDWGYIFNMPDTVQSPLVLTQSVSRLHHPSLCSPPQASAVRAGPGREHRSDIPLPTLVWGCAKSALKKENPEVAKECAYPKIKVEFWFSWFSQGRAPPPASQRGVQGKLTGGSLSIV